VRVLPPPDVSLLALLNLVAFVTWGFDKSRARRGRSRVPEVRLLVLALLCGGPGAWLGVFVFRHKTRKARFLVPLVLVTAAGAAGWVRWFAR
jgi:uncharacterized membrane protein YsdA (DUF1294 family)